MRLYDSAEYLFLIWIKAARIFFAFLLRALDYNSLTGRYASVDLGQKLETPSMGVARVQVRGGGGAVKMVLIVL